MAYDVTAFRAQFPALAAGGAHFDGPGGTQTPRPVIDAIGAALAAPLSNRGAHTPGERNADRIVHEARTAVADLLGSEPGSVVFGRSATQLTYDLARTLARTWAPGDEVVVTRLDHDANIRPWTQAAEAVGATVRWADFDPGSGELTPEHIATVLSARTRLVAVTGAANLIGTMPPLARIAPLVHDAGALLHVDGVHYTAHAFVDLADLGADSYVCSPYKFLGPHLGVLTARPALLERLRPDKLLPSSNAVPERFELGTLPYELLAGTRAAVDVIASLGDPLPAGGRTDSPAPARRERLRRAFEAVEAHELKLRERIETGLASLPGVRLYARAARRTPTLLVGFEGRDPEDACRFLAGRGVVAPAGSFYALEASRRLGLGDAGALRIGLAPYSDDGDVDRLLEGLEAFANGSGA